MAVTLRGPVRLRWSFGPTTSSISGLHQAMNDGQAETDRGREQSLSRRADELIERVLSLSGKRQLRASKSVTTCGLDTFSRLLPVVSDLADTPHVPNRGG